MIRFVDGFNKPIAKTLQLQTYIDLDEAVHKANEIEQQLKEQGPCSFTTSQYYKGNDSNSTFKNSKLPFTTNNLSGSNTKRTREIECLKCKGHGHYSRDYPNTRLLLIKENGEHTSNSDNSDMKEFMENVTYGGGIFEEEMIEPTNEEDEF
ncbi:Transposon Ty3-I Gag-Pol polyprotein [Gossypium australe]|uniref:Transposon Ty3-I Gag-Pol polyprotein n=1 Tax=Gossypium australe TaxID=47621 RepID=A0A5B6VN73_9ROSI|nr:Transposon Ty3-I Gag-Pol polyprotein [Gossypium australe]